MTVVATNQASSGDSGGGTARSATAVALCVLFAAISPHLGAAPGALVAHTAHRTDLAMQRLQQAGFNTPAALAALVSPVRFCE